MKFKRLNRKGFTLVELLAVIIILAIVVGITIPAVLNSVSDAREKSLETSAKTMAEWFEKNYQLAAINDSDVASPDSNFVKICGTNGSTCTTDAGVTLTIASDSTAANILALKGAGVNPFNYSKVVIKIDKDNSRACIKVTAASTGDYKGAGEKSGGICPTPATP